MEIASGEYLNEHPEVNGKCNKVWCGDGGMRDREGGKASCRAQFSNSAHNFGNWANQTLSSVSTKSPRCQVLAMQATLLTTLGRLTLPESSKTSASQRPKFEAFPCNASHGSLGEEWIPLISSAADFPPEIVGP